MTQAVSSYPQFAFHLVTNALNAFTIYDFFDDGLAEVLGLKTYTHGTAPKCNYNILWTGADPRFGGSEKLGEGATYKHSGMSRPTSEDWNSRGKFYVGPDTGLSEFPSCAPCAFLWKKCQPRGYAGGATAGTFGADGCEGLSWPCGCLFSTFSPTIKFRFLPEEAEAQNFRNDPTVPAGMAAYTKKPITPDHIGLYGTLTRALQGNIFERIEQDPERLLSGLTKIAIAIALLAVAVFGMAYAPALVTFWLMWDASVFVGRVAIPLILGNISTLEAPA